MASLTALTPAQDLTPITIGGVTLSEEVPEAIAALMPYAGQTKALSAALKEAHGLALPGPNRMTKSDSHRATWSGLDQAFLIGPPPASELATHSAVVDQSDAWVVLTLEGKGVEDVLARLTPIDLRGGSFKRGHAARSLLGHMNAVFARDAVDRITIMVFRSMAQTAVHELEEAMKGVAARASAN